MQGILLAAGFGKRFDVEQDKLLATINGKPVLWHSANSVITALPNSIAVIQAHQIERQKILQDLGFQVLVSTRAKDGMGYAIADAVQASESAKGWLIALADMPWVSSALIQQVSTHITQASSIATPRFHGKRGQPAAFGAAWFETLTKLQGDQGARALFQAEKITWIDWHDDSIHRDVDTMSDIDGKQ